MSELEKAEERLIQELICVYGKDWFEKVEILGSPKISIKF